MPRLITILALALSAAPAASFAQTPSPEPVTFNRDVAPILFNRCVSCHRPGEFAPFSLLTYEDARQRARLIADVTLHHVMPPWKPDSECCEFEGDRRMHDAEILTLQQWVADGAPEGSPADLPRLPEVTPGWQLGPPDLIVTLPEAYVVPEEGQDIFRNFVLDVPLRGRRYVAAIEFRPGNARVVHHARILIDDSGETRQRDAQDPGVGFAGMDAPGARFPDGHFLGWAPGKLPKREASAWPIEPGTDFVVQVHLKPTGRFERLQPSIGLYFSDRAPSVTPVMLRMGSRTIDIPPGESAYSITDAYTLPVAATLLRIYPHAHYLGREMTVQAVLPGGQRQGLFHIADWDFNWQDEYVYARPMELPRGTRLEMTYTYDNSAGNPRNPQTPPERVRFGPLTRDEMGELLVQLLPATFEESVALHADVMRKALADDIAGEEKRIADDPDDYETRNALGVHYVQAGRAAQARAQFAEAIRLSPGHAVAHYNLGVIELAEGHAAEATAHLERAIAARPHYVEAHTNLAVLRAASGRERDAARHYRDALAEKPGHIAALNNLARLLVGAGDPGLQNPDEAVKLAERAKELTGGHNLSVLDTLAAAYAASGRIDFAVRTAREAFQLAQAGGDALVTRRLRERLEAYESLR
jgi:Flp pilus assembly protein TadD